jgi:hypothetical protein
MRLKRIVIIAPLASLAPISCGTGGPSIHPSLLQERAMGGIGFINYFDYVHVYALAN